MDFCTIEICVLHGNQDSMLDFVVTSNPALNRKLGNILIVCCRRHALRRRCVEERRRMQGRDWESKAQEAYAEGLTEESNYLRGGSEV